MKREDQFIPRLRAEGLISTMVMAMVNPERKRT